MSDDNIEKQMPLWYVMDEFGCAIRHSDEPNFRTVPFIYVPTGVSYTLLFPVKDVANGEEVTRDFVYGVTDILLRKALLLPWKSSSFRDIEFQGVEVDEEYFIQGRLIDTLPTVSQQSNFLTDDCNHSLKIYSEYKYINEYLKLSNFEFVDDPESADILWFTSHFKDYKKLSLEAPHKFVNQFPFENVITVKDLLYYVCKRAGCNEIATNKLFGPSWLITSYNLKLELPQFISYFQHCSDLQLDNYWICKPWNLARGLDTLITNNLNCIIRQSTSGPKICQKYITNPLLFYRDSIGKVKFDIRYIVLLKSVQPLRAYVYKNFFLRFANKPFDLSNLNDYEKHFTVMNYNNDAKLCKMLCNEFVFQFCQQYPDNEWCVIENKILLMIREILVAATSEDPPCGIGVSPQSRALYGIDLILEETEHNGIVPRLLEVNWLPDCKRACEYYPEFYNDVFSALFLNINNGSMYEL
ncbi:hypothetical protein AAG570_007655 [Ranatra chinensis]|uniref:Tubulin--tyrosine ligase-like protein 12 SET-like domain-containing protein n=1 Tax=Ranatra chinensis TaxID=642074 RepID=A0ABD0XU67_9HEMI